MARVSWQAGRQPAARGGLKSQLATAPPWPHLSFFKKQKQGTSACCVPWVGPPWC